MESLGSLWAALPRGDAASGQYILVDPPSVLPLLMTGH